MDLTFDGTNCTTDVGGSCPGQPTAWVVPGPGVGELTLSYHSNAGDSGTTSWEIVNPDGTKSNITGDGTSAANPGTKHYTGLSAGVGHTVNVRAYGSTGIKFLAVESNALRPLRYLPDKTAPKIDLVRVVSTATADEVGSDERADTYVQGDLIVVDVEMANKKEGVLAPDPDEKIGWEAIEVTGGNSNVKLRLRIGSNNRDVSLHSVLNGGRTLRFAYTVVAADSDTNGFEVVANGGKAIALSGSAAIKNADTSVDADLTWAGPLAAGARARVDGSTTTRMGPRPLSAKVPRKNRFSTDETSTTLEITFDKNLSWGSDGGLMANLSVQNTGDENGGNRNGYQHPTAVALKSGDSKTLVLTLGLLVKNSDTVTVSHFYSGGNRELKDTSGNPAPSFRDLAVTNALSRNAFGNVAGPAPVRADVAGRSLRVVFSEAVTLSETLPLNQSAFRVDWSDNDLGRGSISGCSAVNTQNGCVTSTPSATGSELTVWLEEAVPPDARATVSFTKPSGAARLYASKAVLSFDKFLIGTVHDVNVPTLVDWWLAESGSTTSRLTLTFSEPLDTGSVPAATDFTLTGGTPAIPSSTVFSTIAMAANGVTLTTNAQITDGTTGITLTYTPGTNPLQDRQGNRVASISQTVFDRAPGSAPKPANKAGNPKVNGETVTVEMNATALDPTSIPPTSAFTLHHPSYTLNGVTVRDTYHNSVVRVTPMKHNQVPKHRVELLLAAPVTPCEGETPFTLSYDAPDTGANIQSINGTGSRDWTHLSVTNELHSRCADWLAGTYMGSVILKSERPFARDRGDPEPSWFTVTASGGPVTVTEAAFSPDDPKELKLELSREFAAGETVTVSYRRPAGASGLWDVEGNQLRDVVDEPVAAGPPALSVSDARAIEGQAVEFTVSLSAASGAAVTVDYATSDGTAAAGADYTAASGTLTFAAGETLKTVEVRTLSDTAAESDETLTLTLANASGATIADGEATGTVTDVPPPLTASFHGLPEAHDGSRLFGFEIRFSEEFDGLRLTALEAGALVVTGGRLVDVKRTVRGQNRSVTVRVRPSAAADLTLTLAAPADCTASNAVCTREGRKLSASVSATVPGPHEPETPETPPAPLPVLAVADARADEGQALAFAVTLSEAAAGNVTVDYATADGSAAAGTDYTAASGTLTFSPGDTSKTVAVNALTDTAVEGDETLTLTLSNPSGATLGSASATGTLVDVLPPLTASFHGLPAEHNGKKLFAFEVRFSEEFRGMRLTALKAGALQVTNGRIVDAKRTVRGQNRSVTVRVRPASNDDVTLTLPATTDCSAASAICASDGRKLSAPVSATVQGPALLSVADAEGTEGEDDGIDFAVTLSRAASGPVTVNYATADGTATAGEDYTATSGTLTFAAGVTAMTVTVPLLDDVLDDGGETFVLKLSNPHGAAIHDGEGRATIHNSDPMPRAWTARFGRTVAVHLLDALEARLDAAPDSWLQVGGHRLGGGPDVRDTVERLAPDRSLWEEADTVQAADPAGQSVTFKDLLLGSAFHLVSNDEEPSGPRLSAWGRVATSGFDGQENKVSLDGRVTTAALGVDSDWKRWLTGLILAHSVGDGSFSHLDMPGGDLESSLTSLHPYAAYRLSERVRLWGMFGYGSGDLRLTLQDRSMDTDLFMTMVALGARGRLLDPSRAGGLALAVRSDVLWVGMDSVLTDDLAETHADVGRLRLVLEASRPVALAGGGSFTPSLEVGLRHDAGDAETGSGVEVGGSLVYASAWGLSIEASVRGLLAHEDADYQEWGASGALRYDPGRQGTGFTAAIVPAWGSAASGMSRLWEQVGTAGLVADNAPAAPTGRLDAELGYGLAALQGRGLLTPYARVALSEGAEQAWHLGTRLALRESLDLSLEASRRAVEGQAAAHEVALRASLGW